MPLHGKIVVIKRSGGDGTEFPLTTSCLFGRKPDCDIRIQLPQVSKEHCKIELNENKELILTNLSAVNPTRINGQVLQQSERLKHGDLITIIDRSFRFEYPPAPTPKKKRPSITGKSETLQVLQDQQVRDTGVSIPAEKTKSELTSDTCLKDGSNLPLSAEGTIESAHERASNLGESKPTKDSMSPFGELYQMIKQDLDAKSPWKSFGVQPKTPVSRQSSHRPAEVKNEHGSAIAGDVRSTPKVVPHITKAVNEVAPETPKSSQKKRRSSKGKTEEKPESASQTNLLGTPQDKQLVENAGKSATPKGALEGQKRQSIVSEGSTPISQKKKTPQRQSAEDIAQQMISEPESMEKTPKSQKRKRSGVSCPQSPAVLSKSQTTPQTPAITDGNITDQSQAPEDEGPDKKKSLRTSPRARTGKSPQVQNVLTSDVKDNHQESVMLTPAPKRKRVSFGGQLSPELFDKRLPPNSPLRRGATPGRRSLSLSQKPQSLLRRASAIGLIQSLSIKETTPESPRAESSPAQKASSKRLTDSPKSAKNASPAKKSPSKAKTPSPKSKIKTPSPGRQKSTPKQELRTPNGASPSTSGPNTTPRKVKSASPKQRVKTPSLSSSPAATKSSPSARRASSPMTKTPSSGLSSLPGTPTVTGRFSVSRISTPSPVTDEVGEAKEDCASGLETQQQCVTPKIPLRRKSMKASAKKTPKSAMKSALEVIRSRRSGASRANLKVLSSWADIVKFGQSKPQNEITVKRIAAKGKTVKKTTTLQPKTPARKLKDHVSTGHADSPVTIIVGKAQMRAAQITGAAPKLVPNIAVSKKDMKMDEDFTRLADMLKTPASKKQKPAVCSDNDCLQTPVGDPSSSLTELSVVHTPEGTGEMMVSPLSITSTAKRGRYNSDAITRLLQDNQVVSLDSEDASSQAEDSNIVPGPGDRPLFEVPSFSSAEEQESDSDTAVKTPQQKPVPDSCLTGVKRLMKTPKQRVEPVEDLRGRLLKTPKERKPEEETLIGVKELMKTPKHKGVPVEDMAGVKRVMQTPKVKNSPVVCTTGIKRLMKTPKEKRDQVVDLTGVKELMNTPKTKGEAVEEILGVKRLMKTPVEPIICSTSEALEPTRSEMVESHEEKDMVPSEESASDPVVMEEMQKEKDDNGPLTVAVEVLKSGDDQCLLEAASADQVGLEVEAKMNDVDDSVSQVDGNTSPAEEISAEADKSEAAVCTSETICSAVGAHVELEKEPLFSPPVKRTRGKRTKAGQEPEKDKDDSTVDPVSTDLAEEDEKKTETAETIVPESTPVKGRRAKETVESSKAVPVPRASGRRRVPKNRVENETNSVMAPLDPVDAETPACPPADVKRKRGPNAKQDSTEVLENAPEVTPESKTSEPSTEMVKSQEEPLTSQAQVTKPRRGRKAKQDSANPVVEVVEDVNAVPSVVPELQSVEPPMKEDEPKEQTSASPAPALKPKRGRRAKQEMDVLSKEADFTPSLEEAEGPATATTKPKRGGRAKQASVEDSQDKKETTPVTEVLPEKTEEQSQTELKSVRGRRTKRGTVMIPTEVVEPPAENPVSSHETEEKPQVTDIKPGRGRRTRQAKPQLAENAEDKTDVQPAVEAAVPVSDANEQPETVVKTGRRGRMAAKQPNTPIITNKEEEECKAETQEKNTDTTVDGEQVEILVRSGRRRKAATVEDNDEHEVPVKRGRRGAAGTVKQATPARTPRGRRTAPEVDQAVAAEEMEAVIEPIKKSRGAAATPETKSDEISAVQPSSEEGALSNIENTISDVTKGRRGRPTRKGKTAVNQCDEPVTVEEDGMNEQGKGQTRKKSVKWRTDLVSAKDSEEAESSLEAEEPQPKKARKVSVPAAEATTEKTQASEQQLSNTPSKTRRGRGTGKQAEMIEETPSQESEAAAETETKPVRRGRRGASALPRSKSANKDVPLKAEGKEKDVGEETVDEHREPTPKKTSRAVKDKVQIEMSQPTRGRRGASKKTESVPDVEAEKSKPCPPQETPKSTRGRKNITQEADTVPVEKNAVSRKREVTTRGGSSRSQKAEPVTPAETAAPVRRTRRK